MLYREMPRIGDKLSILGFGCMRLPTRAGRIDYKESRSQLRYAIDNGVNYIDTAWPYHAGGSEKFLADALSEGYREKIKLATKLPQYLCNKKEDMYSFLEKQLKKLNVQMIDYYLIHALNGNAWEKMKNYGILEFMNEIKKTGKIKNIGFSFHGTVDSFIKIIDEYNWDFCQIQYNIMDENNQAGTKGLKYAALKGLGVVIMEPLLGGSLARELPKKVEEVYKKAELKRSNAEWALRWVWNHPEVKVVLSGMNNMEHIKENIRIASEALPNSLNDSEMKIVSEAAKVFKSLRKVPCTGCRYCMPCPAGVDIPSAFEIYNNRYLFNKKGSSSFNYLNRLGSLMGGEKHLVSQCIECGKCVEACPQSINVPEELKKVKKEFEGPLNRFILAAGRGFYKLRDGKQKKK